MNAHLQAAKDRLAARRATRPPHSRRRFVSSQHRNYGLAWAPASIDLKSQRYFKIRYCRDCLKGTVIDMVRDIDGLDDARALGIRQQRPWQLTCAEQVASSAALPLPRS